MKIKNNFFIFILVLILSACSKKTTKYERDGFFFGTYIRVIVYSDDKKNANNGIEKAFEEIKRIDERYNSKVKNSIIYKLNNFENKEVLLDAEGEYIFSKINDAFIESDDTYDVTIGPLLDVWSFDKGIREKLPSKIEIENALKKINFSNVYDGKNKLVIRNKKIDTGSFLKGYAMERAKAVLMKEGISNGIVSSISSIATIGGKNKNNPWIIGIQDPNNSKKSIGSIELIGKSVGVTGDYQTYVMIGNKKYHHVLSKKTGYPVEDKKMVVVICDSAFLADIYSTAFFGMEIEKIKEVAKNKNIEFLIVKNNTEIIKSENFKILYNQKM